MIGARAISKPSTDGKGAQLQPLPCWGTEEENRVVRAALSQLQLFTIPRKEGEADRIARLKLYLRELRYFPLDRVLNALREWPKQGARQDGTRPGRHFPAWDEMLLFLAPPTRPAEHVEFLPKPEFKNDPAVGKGLAELSAELHARSAGRAEITDSRETESIAAAAERAKLLRDLVKGLRMGRG